MKGVVHRVDIEQVIDEYGNYLYRIAYMMTKDVQIAEEVVQDTFMKFYQSNQFQQNASLKTYLTRIAINCCHDHLRWWKIRKPQLFKMQKTSEHAAEHTVIKQLEKDEMIALIFTLPTTYREVIVLYYFDDLSVSEIAQILHIPVSTVTTRLQRAKHKLKPLLSSAEWEVLRDA